MIERLDHLLGNTKKVIDARNTDEWAKKLDLLIADCHPKQRSFVLDPGRRVAALVARGGGKTTGGRARFVRRMMTTPKAQCLYVATTRQAASELMWMSLKDLLERMGVEARFNETQLTCTLIKNRSRLRLVGADDKREIEKLRGQPFHEVGVDEGASFDPILLEHLLFRIIGPRLGDYNGVIWVIGTPSHVLRGPFYDASRPGSDISRLWSERDKYPDWLRWSLHKWNLQDGATTVPAMQRLWSEALLEKEANGWSDQHPVWRREYLGEWCGDDTENVFKYRPHLEDGTPWNVWNPKNPFKELPEGHEWRFVYGMDLGHSDPFALEVLAYSPTNKNLYHVYEFEKRGMYARTIAEHLIGPALDHNKMAGIIAKTGWPDGMVADMAGMGDALLAELSSVYGITIEPAEKKNKHDSIELFNGDLIDGRIKILKGSKLEEQLIHLQWDIDDNGKLREDKGQRNDCTDAAIYARRKALHQFWQDPPLPKPKPGTDEAAKLKAEEDEAREAGLNESEFMLGDEDFTKFFR